MKKARIVTVASVIALAVIAVIVIFVSRGRNMHEFTCDLYFLNETGTSLSAESREIKYRNEIDLPKAVIEKLLKGPDNPRLIRTIGKDVDLLGIDMSDPNNVSVNFSGGYITDDTAKDILTTYSVVKSLCEIYYVDSVKVLVEGADIINPDGEPIGYLTASDINLSTDTNTTEAREIMLYFTRKDYQLLVPEMRTVKVTDQQPIEQYIINELISGPAAKEFEPTLSKDTVLLSVDTEDGICFVNFKSSFLDKNSGNQEKEILAIYSIVDSLTELENITRVQFLMDGKKVDMFGTINISSMFGRNSDMIEN